MRRRGGVALEMALMLPILLLLLVGAVDWGWFLVQEAALVIVARDAAHAGSLSQDAPAATATARAEGALVAHNLPLDDAEVDVQLRGETWGGAVDVRVTAPFSPIVGLVPVPSHLSARTVMRLED